MVRELNCDMKCFDVKNGNIQCLYIDVGRSWVFCSFCFDCEWFED